MSKRHDLLSSIDSILDEIDEVDRAAQKLSVGLRVDRVIESATPGYASFSGIDWAVEVLWEDLASGKLTSEDIEAMSVPEDRIALAYRRRYSPEKLRRIRLATGLRQRVQHDVECACMGEREETYPRKENLCFHPLFNDVSDWNRDVVLNPVDGIETMLQLEYGETAADGLSPARWRENWGRQQARIRQRRAARLYACRVTRTHRRRQLRQKVRTHGHTHRNAW